MEPDDSTDRSHKRPRSDPLSRADKAAAKLLRDKRYHDVRFRCSGGSTASANRAFLAACSEYFERLLYGHPSEGGQSAVAMPTTNAAALAHVLEYLHTDAVPGSDTPLAELLEASVLAQQLLLGELCSRLHRPILHSIAPARLCWGLSWALERGQHLLLKQLWLHCVPALCAAAGGRIVADERKPYWQAGVIATPWHWRGHIIQSASMRHAWETQQQEQRQWREQRQRQWQQQMHPRQQQAQMQLPTFEGCTATAVQLYLQQAAVLSAYPEHAVLRALLQWANGIHNDGSAVASTSDGASCSTATGEAPGNDSQQAALPSLLHCVQWQNIDVRSIQEQQQHGLFTPEQALLAYQLKGASSGVLLHQQHSDVQLAGQLCSMHDRGSTFLVCNSSTITSGCLAQGFTSGKHSWLVQVEQSCQGLCVGVADSTLASSAPGGWQPGGWFIGDTDASLHYNRPTEPMQREARCWGTGSCLVMLLDADEGELWVAHAGSAVRPELAFSGLPRGRMLYPAVSMSSGGCVRLIVRSVVQLDGG